MKLNVDDLVEQGLVKKKTYTEGQYKGLSVLKYSRKVFYDNLWHLDDRLLECRGTVVDEDDNVIVRPFKKVFNLHENSTEVEEDLSIIAPRKVNGFMCAVTKTDTHGIIVSTTGSLDSEFVSLAKSHIVKLNEQHFWKGYTYLFEICDDFDPHIVKEVEGAYLIGIRKIKTGNLCTEYVCDEIAKFLKVYRPKVISCKFKDLPVTNMEGYMIRVDDEVQGVVCKLKSPHYLSKKALQRVGKNKASKMWNTPTQFKQQLDEEFYAIFEYLIDKYTKEEYLSFTEQQRRHLIEEYFDGK